MGRSDHDRSTRRRFLAGLGAASVVLIASGCQPVPGVPTLPVGGPGGTDGSDGPDRTPTPARVADPLLGSAWTPLVGATFALGGAAGTAAAVLDEVRANGPGDRTFRLAFRAVDPAAPVVDHVTTVVDPAGTSHRLDLFPADRGVHHRWYVAVVAADA